MFGASGPILSKIVPSFNFSFPGAYPFSAELTGSLLADEHADYTFDCNLSAATVAFLFVDDHLVCQTGAYEVPPGAYDQPIRRLSKTLLPVRLEVFFDPHNNIHDGVAELVSVSTSVTITHDHLGKKGLAATGRPNPELILLPQLSGPEIMRRNMQRNLVNQGWGFWNHDSLLDFAHLPSGAVLRILICPFGNFTEATEKCEAVPARPDDNARVEGPLAYDFSYGAFSVRDEAAEWEVRVRFSGGERLSATIELLGSDALGEEYFILVSAGSLWQRRVDIFRPIEGSMILLEPWGLPGIKIFAGTDDSATGKTADTSTARRILRHYNTPSQIAMPISLGQIVSLNSGHRATVKDLTSSLNEREEREERRIRVKFGERAGIKRATQAALAWNIVYVPTEAGPIAPVSRGWGRNLCPAKSPEWTYVTFAWDNIFASYMLSLDAKELAYSNLIQSVRSKTNYGFIPNFSAGPAKSFDRSEPPVGSAVMLKMYGKYGDLWLVELLYNDLLDWNNWFFANRIAPPMNLVVLGGDTMQNARYESGLDNSPMYDGHFFDESTHRMNMYDVGMSSLVAMDAEALADLAAAAGRPEADLLRRRASLLRQGISRHLWDAKLGAFSNRFVNGTFYRRISPTSFYPLLAGAASEAQADALMTGHLLNASRFCISPSASRTRSDSCYWGLPSISADDPAYLTEVGGHVYWRGSVWGPMAQLLYWGLERYGDVGSAREARVALCRQMAGMMMEVWERTGHICENYGPQRSDLDCTGNRFYHWGGLAGFIDLLEQGFYL